VAIKPMGKRIDENRALIQKKENFLKNFSQKTNKNIPRGKGLG